MILSGIYAKIIEGRTFQEKYGVYYQTEEDNGTSSDSDGNYSASSTGTTNDSTKKKRVITYIRKY